VIIAAPMLPSGAARRTVLAGIFTLTLAVLARADAIKMPNGETLRGTIVQETAEQVVFQSASFGELRIPRAPGMTLERSGSLAPAAPAVASGSTPAPAAPPGGGPAGPGAEPPSAVKRFLGLSDRWSLELEANLMVQNDKFHATAHGTELTIGYRVPNETKPTQPRHEYGLFAAHNYQKVNSTVVGENSEVAARYFYQPLSPWLLVSQADWMRDRINGVDSRSHVLAIPSYRFIDTPRTRLLAGIGPSYLSDTRLIPTGPTTTVKDTDAGFRVGFYELFLQTLTPGLKFRQTLVVLGRANDPSATYNLRFEASLRRQLTPHLSLNLGYDYVRDENAAFDIESIATLKLMLGYHF
jgi:putative salt-induced outer membrane protein YdiY